MATATKPEMAELHALVAKKLKSDINNPDEEVRLKAISQAIKFLKDNHIEVESQPETQAEELLHELQELEVPFPQCN